jgi:hypothetical protein
MYGLHSVHNPFGDAASAHSSRFTQTAFEDIITALPQADLRLELSFSRTCWCGQVNLSPRALLTPSDRVFREVVEYIPTWRVMSGPRGDLIHERFGASR